MQTASFLVGFMAMAWAPTAAGEFPARQGEGAELLGNTEVAFGAERRRLLDLADRALGLGRFLLAAPHIGVEAVLRQKLVVALQATLFKPENFDAAKKYPLMVYIYERLSEGLHNFATVLARGEVSLDAACDLDVFVAQLVELPGIGPWTAHYLAMRALHLPDAFPAADLGIQKALGRAGARAAEARAEAWRPYRSYAVMHLWTALSEGERP